MSEELRSTRVIECKSREGLVVGLLDAIMTCASVAMARIRRYDEDQMPDSVGEACSDLFQNQDLRHIIAFGGNRTYPDGTLSFTEQLTKEVFERLTAAEAELATLREENARLKADQQGVARAAELMGRMIDDALETPAGKEGNNAG